MFDIGWPELLVVAIVLIVVVGPKDLPPMLRAFGRTTKKLRGMANEFRGQFDEALREAELDDVKKSFDDARKLNPMQTIRDAVNPLKDSAKAIRSDLEKSVNSPSDTPAWKPKTEIPDATMKLPESPPDIKTAGAAAAASGGKAASAPKSTSETPANGSVSAKTSDKPKAAPKPARTASTAKPAPAASVAKKAPSSKAKAEGAPKPAAQTRAADSKTAGKAAPRAAKSKKGEGQA